MSVSCYGRERDEDASFWIMSHTPNCPTCGSDDLITISMSVSGRDLAFTTCHVCETKWWHRDGESVPLQSVIGMVVQKA
jgi:DNA polymerase III alpha subunit (gram-positive type)